MSISTKSNDGDVLSADKMDTYVKKLLWIVRWTAMWLCPSLPRWKRIANLSIAAFVLTFAIYGIYFEISIIYQRGFKPDVTTSTTLCAVLWTSQAVISLVFLIHWQLSGKMIFYMKNVILFQQGESVAAGKKLLNGKIRRFHFVNVMLFMMIAVHYFGDDIVHFEHRVFYEQSKTWMRPLHSICTLHVFLCWNITIYIFNIFIDGAYLDLCYFNQKVSEISETEETQLKKKLLQLINDHARIARTIRNLNSLFSVYAFTMIATMIPSILLTVIMIAHRIKYVDELFIMGFPAFVLTLYGFLGLTLSPARLYDEAYRSKTCLCLNAVVWQPYRPEIYQIAMSLSSHMEQSNMGITIWGFAILTKPLILATFSVMAMIMSLLMEIVPQRNDKETK